MSTSAQIASGTLFQRGDGASPEVFTTLAEVTNIDDIGADSDLIEVTHMQSTAKEYIYGLQDGIEFSVTANLLPANVTWLAMKADQVARLTRNFRIVLPSSGGTFSFAALVRSWRASMPEPNGVMKAVFTLKVSGSITGPV